MICIDFEHFLITRVTAYLTALPSPHKTGRIVIITSIAKEKKIRIDPLVRFSCKHAACEYICYFWITSSICSLLYNDLQLGRLLHAFPITYAFKLALLIIFILIVFLPKKFQNMLIKNQYEDSRAEDTGAVVLCSSGHAGEGICASHRVLSRLHDLRNRADSSEEPAGEDDDGKSLTRFVV